MASAIEEDYRIVEWRKGEKLLWEDEEGERRLSISYSNGGMPSELAALSDMEILPEEMDEVVREAGYSQQKVSDGKIRLQNQGVLEEDGSVNIPDGALDEISGNYSASLRKLILDKDSLDLKPYPGNFIEDKDHGDEVLEYLSTERTDFWDLVEDICNDMYEDMSVTESITYAGDLLDQLEADEYKNVEGDKEEGYRLLE